MCINIKYRLTPRFFRTSPKNTITIKIFLPQQVIIVRRTTRRSLKSSEGLLSCHRPSVCVLNLSLQLGA